MVAVGCLLIVYCSVQPCMFSPNPPPLSAPTDLFTCCPPLAIMPASCPLSMAGLRCPLPHLPLVALLHYHRRSHHPSSLTSQCPSSSLSIPEPACYSLLCTVLCNLSRSAVWTAEEVFTVHCFSSAGLSSALMDLAMQSDQGSAQTPAYHRNSMRSSPFRQKITFCKLAATHDRSLDQVEASS